jgi:hypothetical protein
MNYLKLTNAIYVLRGDKYSSKDNQINWSALGFTPIQIQTLAIQYIINGSDLVHYLPISDEDLLNTHMANIQADLAETGVGTAEIIAEDRATWEAEAAAANDPDANLTEQEKRNKERDRLISIATVTIRGVNLWVSESEIDKMLKYEAQSQALLGLPVSWKGYNATTGDIERIDLNNTDILNLAKTLLITGQSIHLESDTQMPTDPWPVDVVE